MSSRPSRAEHEAALARRLELLGEELASVRGADGSVTRPRVRTPPAPAPSPDPPPAFPVPGRHAARRPGRWATALPEPMRGRVGLGPGPLAVVAVLVAVGLGVTAWWVVRSDSVPVAPVAPTTAPALVTGAPPADGVPAADRTGTAADATVTVDVAGKVRRPGIAILDAGSRVVDALRAAGGARPGVDLTGLNLARVLVDGEQIVVGIPAPAGPLPTAGSPTGTLVDLNTATTVELESLPEVGPVTAQAIIIWREEHGGFTDVQELLEVDGIGEATLETIAPFVTV